MTLTKRKRLKRKIIESRTRLAKEQPFFAVLLMYLRYVADDNVQKISTDGRCIYFSPDFLDKLYPPEVDFVLCHLAMHIVREDIWCARDQKGDSYHHACNIIINSILDNCGYEQKRFPHLGTICKDIYPYMDPGSCSTEEILSALPFRMESLEPRIRRQYLFDSDEWWGCQCKSGHREIILCSADEPAEYTNGIIPCTEDQAERSRFHGKNDTDMPLGSDSKESLMPSGSAAETESDLKSLWRLRVKTAEKLSEVIEQNGAVGIGTLPALSDRRIGNSAKPVTDWKTVLEAFVQEQTCDYSFLPPDKRFGDSDVFLPDFNEKESVMKNVLFMIDTSGSFNDNMIAEAFSEIEGALEQFNGLLEGKIGFFDTKVYSVADFSTVFELRKMMPVGGGGTDFSPIFDHIENEMQNDISSLVILTDGYGAFPEDRTSTPYPVLWLINNEEITPPFGKIARIPQ